MYAVEDYSTDEERQVYTPKKSARDAPGAPMKKAKQEPRVQQLALRDLSDGEIEEQEDIPQVYTPKKRGRDAPGAPRKAPKYDFSVEREDVCVFFRPAMLQEAMRRADMVIITTTAAKDLVHRSACPRLARTRLNIVVTTAEAAGVKRCPVCYNL